MRIRDAEKKYCISDESLNQYVKSGILQAKETPDGDLDLEEQYLLDDLVLIRFFIRAGFSEEEIRKYLELSRKENMEKECIRMLRKHRGGLLEDIHNKQQILDRLDFIIWEKQHRKNGKNLD